MYQRAIAMFTLELEQTVKTAKEYDDKAEAIFQLLEQIEDSGVLPKGMDPDDLIHITQQMTYLDEAKAAISKLSQILTMRISKLTNLQKALEFTPEPIEGTKIRKINPKLN